MSEPTEPVPAGERGVLTRLLRLSALFEDGILVLVLATMVVLAVAQIVLRNVFSSGLVWGDALLRVMVLWVAMLGAVAATRDDRQITVDVLGRILPPRAKAAVRVLTDVFTAAVSAFLVWCGWRLILVDRLDGSIAFASVPVWVCELVLPLAFAIIGWRYAVFAVVHLRQALRERERP